MAPRVSVVVPVYNAGRYLEPAITSILGQTLARRDIEAVFVDDGSNDESPDRLDRLAVEHPDVVRVIHEPPSGAPGRPRNIGLAAARGEYVQFLDADDELAPNALERLVAMADRNAADIVIGRFASASITRSQRLFERTVQRTTFRASPWLADSSLGPTKLFRRSLLLDNEILFPVGWRRMEDQMFTLSAYLQARAISILADEPLYFFRRRADGGNLTAEPIDPEIHFDHLRAILDRVDGLGARGLARDSIYRRMLRVEILGMLAEPAYAELSPERRSSLVDGARAILAERFDDRLLAEVGAIGRCRARLAREGRAEALLALAQRLHRVVCASRMEDLGWIGGSLVVDGTIGLADDDRPGWAWLPRVRTAARTFLDLGELDSIGGRLDVGAERGPRIDLLLRDRGRAVEWYVEALPRRGRARSRIDPGASGSTAAPVAFARRVIVDPERVGPGRRRLSPGTWDVLVRLDVFGLTRVGALDQDPATPAPAPALLGDPARAVVPVLDRAGLRLEVDAPAPVLARALAGSPVRVVRDGRRLVLELAMVAGPGAGRLPAALVVGPPAQERVIAAELRGRLGRVVVDARLGSSAELAAGLVPLRLRLSSEPGADVDLGAGRLTSSGFRVVGAPRLTVWQGLRARLAWPLTRVGQAAGASSRALRNEILARARTAARRLPDGPRRLVRALDRSRR